MAAQSILRVATYNVHGCVGGDGRHDPDRVASVINELNVDVAALQEFTYPLDVALETRTPVVLTSLDGYQCALGPTRQTTRHCFGNVLLTRHPIRHVHRLETTASFQAAELVIDDKQQQRAFVLSLFANAPVSV